jgi:hypothetical protein
VATMVLVGMTVPSFSSTEVPVALRGSRRYETSALGQKLT